MLRPDATGPREAEEIYKRLTEGSEVRCRCLLLLQDPAVTGIAESAGRSNNGGTVERAVLLEGLRPRLNPAAGDVDRTIDFAIRFIDLLERVSILVEAGFRSLLWGLVQFGGRATYHELSGQFEVSNSLVNTARRLSELIPKFDRLLSEVPEHPKVADELDLDRFRRLSQSCLAVIGPGPEAIATALLDRHRAVQKAKSKGPWIEGDGSWWTLMPGFGRAALPGWNPAGGFLHPYRVQNARSFLADLRRLTVAEVLDGEA
jgi:hypothetical protein